MKKEPTTNNFLKPMVSELYEAWNIGFNVKSDDGYWVDPSDIIP